MNRIIFLFLLIISVGLYIFNVDQSITNKFRFVNDIKKYYTEKLIGIEEALSKYFLQAKTIEKLSKDNEELKRYKILFTKTQNQLEELLNKHERLNLESADLKLTKVLSYVKFDDYTKVWLDLEKTDKKIEGLISNNYAAGIVVNQSNQSLALLNGNEKSNYAVFIGENKAPGIVHGVENSENIVVKFIPIWINIKVGDEVITSGMDDIFFEGLKVGKVVAIKKMADMQEATVEPYAKVLEETFFYVYSKKPIVKKEIIKKEETSNKKP